MRASLFNYLGNIVNISIFRTMFFLIILGFHSFSALATERINKITIQGNKRVEMPTIQNYLKFQIGNEYNAQKQSEAIKSLYSTGLFDDINIKFENGNLIVVVEETPFISVVSFVGNAKIKEPTLRKELLTQSGDSLSKAKIQSDVEKIKEIYKRSGRFSTVVEPVIEKQENNRVKILFNIHEGPKTGMKYIYFVGNVNYSASELQSIILTKESRWFRLLETNDTYDPDRIEYDKFLLKEFYQSVGFADFRVISATAELSKTKDYFTLTFSIDEGERYKFGKVSIDNKLPNIDIAQVKKFLTIQKGQTFNSKSIEQIIEKIAKNLADKGYPQVNVYEEINPNSSTQLVDVTFVVDKADRVFVNDIEILGNVKTEDRVIRREYQIAEGDIFNRSYIEKGEQNLRNLDYFEKISTKILPTNQKDRYNVVIDVEEKSTSSIGCALGYNTSGGIFGSISFLERNLVGTGNYLNIGVQGSKKSKNYYLSITNPHFLDKDLSLSGSIFKDYSGHSHGFGEAEQPYDLRVIGMKTSIGYNIVEDLNHEIEYTIKRDNLTPLQGASSRFIIEQAGKLVTSALGQTVTYDQTDSKIIPKNGYIASISQEFAGVGGNNHYLKHEIDGKHFTSFLNNKLTLKLSGKTGNIIGLRGNMVRISDRFNLGDYSFRGFSHGGIGPRDKATNEGLGGQNFYTLGAELNFPLGMPAEFNVTGATFAEMGSLWGVSLNKKTKYTKDQFYNDTSLRASVGVGVIWVTRLAPIRIDWAWPIKKTKYDDVQHLHLKFSTHF